MASAAATLPGGLPLVLLTGRDQVRGPPASGDGTRASSVGSSLAPTDDERFFHCHPSLGKGSRFADDPRDELEDEEQDHAQRSYRHFGSVDRPEVTEYQLRGERWFPCASAEGAGPGGGSRRTSTRRVAHALPRQLARGAGRGPGARGPVERTTLVLQSLPLGFKRDMVVEMLQVHGFAGEFNFVYMPCHFATGRHFGYVFVNMTTTAQALDCMEKFEGFSQWPVPSDKICRTAWADVHGLEANIRRFQNSAVMHESISDELKPITLDCHGSRTPFPAPTRTIRAPRTSRLRT